jgi:hypothetical protein
MQQSNSTPMKCSKGTGCFFFSWAKSVAGFSGLLCLSICPLVVHVGLGLFFLELVALPAVEALGCFMLEMAFCL